MRTARLLTVRVYVCVQGSVHNPFDAEADTPPTPEPQTDTHPLVNIMTDTCKNIILPQTSFAGGSNVHTEEISK